MSTCDTCKWWNQNSNWFSLGNKKGQGICEKIKDADFGEDSMAHVIAYHHEDCALRTLPKFGCIHHEPK